MYGDKNPPKPPRNGHTPVVGIVCRISGCANQKEVSLEDQTDHGKEVAVDVYPSVQIDFRTIATKGKGERLDRDELNELEELIRGRVLDLLVAEDLGRIVRGPVAAWLLGLAVDHGTRVISPNDGIDTDDPDWETDALDACKEHLQHNAHVSKRLKHKLMNRFVKGGGAPARETFGYIVPEDAKTYDDWAKNPEAEAVLRHAYDMLRERLNCTAAADWLNSQRVAVGPYCRRTTWTGAMVRRLFKNPLLKGKPGRGFKHTVKHHETGRRVSVPNPKGPKFYDCPHLAFFSAEELDLLNAKLDEKNADFRRADAPELDPLLRVPRKRTRFPGQHARCLYCGREFVWGGNGVTENLMCSGARERRCWNSIGFCGELAAHNIVDTIVGLFKQLNGFEIQFANMVTHARENDVGGLSERWDRLVREEAKLKAEAANLASGIQQYGPRQFLTDKMSEIEDQERRLKIERGELTRIKDSQSAIPGQLNDIWQPLQQAFAVLTAKSPEFGDLMRRIVPEFHVYLVRLCDGGHPLPRARVRLNLAGSIDGLAAHPEIVDWLSRTVTIDLFKPPQRERIRLAAVALASANLGLTNAEIASRLPEEATDTAVANALALHKLMLGMGLKQPYVVVEQPPADYSKLRRHQNPLYRFEPLPGYQPPEL
ncbi:MAG: recombinase family protein [Planctomycetota bacterium]